MAEESANVAQSFVEYRALYKEPIFEAWERVGLLTAAVFNAFS